jgi:dTDP-4-amino-4,6-dideoxygalactose transaminase
MARVYLSPPDVGPADRQALLDAFDSNWIAPLGPDVDAFEAEMAAYVGVAAGAALSSGTAGLHLALAALGVGAGDLVVVPTLTFVATAAAPTYLGARPIFLDSEQASWNLDPDLLEELLVERARRGRIPKAVIGVDLYGQCANWARLESVCTRFGVHLVEDAAEALGASGAGRRAGAFGRVSVLSFNGNKIITTSGGGMVLGDDVALVARARHLAGQARLPAAHYEHAQVGYNYRLSNLLAALGRSQLRTLGEKVARRRAVRARYEAGLADLAGLAFSPVAPWGEPTHWLTCVTLDEAVFGVGPEALRMALEAVDIEARPAWKPLHLQRAFVGAEALGGSVAERVFREGLCLPSGSNLSAVDQDRVIDVVRTVAEHPRRVERSS